LKAKYTKAIFLTQKCVNKIYKYKDIFQILPAPKCAKTLHSGYWGGLYPCIIELKCEYTYNKHLKAIDGGSVDEIWQAYDCYKKSVHEIYILLSAFSIFNFINCQRSTDGQTWFISDFDNPKLTWGKKGYFIDGYDLSILNFTNVDNEEKIKLIDYNNYFTNDAVNINEELILPTNIDVLFESYFNLKNKYKKTFLSACTLLKYGVEIFGQYPSLSYASLISAIETLAANDKSDNNIAPCTKCGYIEYKTTRQFKEFIIKYAGFSNMDKQTIEEYAGQLYNKRCKILHSGSLRLGEIEPINSMEEEHREENKQYEEHRHLIKICRICLINWLLVNNTTNKNP
jgi:hypothetical protein